jgi:hypothetical protein
MRKFLKVTAIVVGVLLVVLVAGAYLVPAKWEVTRSRVVPAAPGAIHAYVADFAKWPAWSPFDHEDPEMRITVGATSAGVGAQRSWTSETMGNGSQTIVAADAAKGMACDLAIEGFPTFRVEFAYEPVAGGTKVTWTDRGESGMNPLHRWFTLLMEPMLGPTFEKGLANLEAAVVAGR